MALTRSGELLKSARLKQNLTLEDVEKATKIRAKFLQSLEEGKADIDSTIIINTEPVSISETGRFSKTMKVFKGDATIVVSAKNRRGKETIVTRHIKVE